MPYPVTTVTLNQNVINAALFNMIISQRVFDSGVASTEIADMFKVDGTLYGDTKLYHSFDIGAPEKWLNDAEAADLLKLNRNKSGVTQSIVMKIYQMIWITTDQYLSKQAFMLEGTFAEYTSFLKGSLRKIRKVYDNAIIKSKIGTLDPSTDACDITVTTPRGSTLEEQNRLSAQYLAARMKVLKADLEDNNRKYNKLDYLRAYNPEELVAFWNVEQSAKITMIDLPTIFHKDFGADKPVMRQYELPQKWFGRALEDSDGTYLAAASPAGYCVSLTTHNYSGTTITAWSGGTLRIKESGWYALNTIANTPIKSDKPVLRYNNTDYNCVYLWAGDEVPKGGTVIKDYARGTTVTVNDHIAWYVDDLYEEDPSIAFVLLHKEALPYMSGFEVGTEFWNGRSLTSTNYLIFGHNELEFLEEYPRIRVKLALEETPSFEAPVQDVNLAKVDGNDIGYSSGNTEGKVPVSIYGSEGDAFDSDTGGTLDVNIKKVGQSENFDYVPVDIANINSDGDNAAYLGAALSRADDNNGSFSVSVDKVAGNDVDSPTGTATEVKITS